MLSFPWVVDGVDRPEMSAITIIRDMMEEHPDFAKEVLGFLWVQDDMLLAEMEAVLAIRDLATNDLALAWQTIGQPFVEPPFLQRDEYALSVLRRWSLGWDDDGSDLLAQLASQPWFNDGLDDSKAALLHALNWSNDDFRRALIETHYVASATVTLPQSGLVGLAVVRHTPFPPDDYTLATLKEGVRVLEDFMGAPLPVGDVILLLVEPEFWTSGGRGWHHSFAQGGGNVEPAYVTSIMEAVNRDPGPPKRTLYHELGHYYLQNGPRWLTEGIAEFLEAYTVARTGGQELEERLAYLESSGSCHENIWQHVNPYRGGRCDYELGEKFLLGMYVALGPEAVSAALRELYTQALIFENPNHDSIYYAFLSNVPPGREEAFRTAYRRYHGGPNVDRVVADSPDLPPLLALYNATNGQDWLNNRHWVSDGPLGAWHGVYTNSRGQVTGLELTDNGLVGEIPAELGNLSHLIGLILRDNELTGVIPPELGTLSNLDELWLSSNQLTGRIPPELGNLTNLRILALSRNGLIGKIPPELGNLTKLTTLMLQGNQLSGEIPAELGNLTGLETLWLEGNQLSGEIPAELGNLTKLTTLTLEENQLSGEIPAELGNLTKLTMLMLHRNQLSGEIPAELGNLTKLTMLMLHGNRLSGEIPAELGNLTNLKRLWLHGNRFTGCIAAELPEIWVEETGLQRCASTGESNP